MDNDGPDRLDEGDRMSDNEMRVSIVIDGVRTQDYERMRRFFDIACGAVAGMLKETDANTVTECGYPYFVIEDSKEAMEREAKE